VTAVQEPPLGVEEWPAQHVRLVEELCAVRPGLRPEQAHAVLQGLRTLRWALHPEAQPCGQQAPARRPGRAVCGATATGSFGATLTCSLAPHAGEPWHDNGKTQWQCIGTNGLWLMTGRMP